MSNVHDLILEGEKIGEIDETPDIIIENSDKCVEILTSLLEMKGLTGKEKRVLNKSLNILSSDEGTKFNFGPGDIIILGNLGSKYPDRCKDITACSHYLTEILTFDGEVDEAAYDAAMAAMAELGELMANIKT